MTTPTNPTHTPSDLDNLFDHLGIQIPGASLAFANNPDNHNSQTVMTILLGLVSKVNSLTTQVHDLEHHARNQDIETAQLRATLNKSTPTQNPKPAPTQNPKPNPKSTNKGKGKSPFPLVAEVLKAGVTAQYYDPEDDQVYWYVNTKPQSYSDALKNKKDSGKAPPAQQQQQTKKPAKPKTPTPLPTAQRCFFTRRDNNSLHALVNKEAFEADLATELGRTLAIAGLTAPHTNISVTSNPRGTITCLASPHTPVTMFTPYFSTFNQLTHLCLLKHQSIEKDAANHLGFQAAPDTIDFAIHGIPKFATPSNGEDPDDIFPAMKSAISIAQDITITAARYLSRLSRRIETSQASVVVFVSREDAPLMPDFIHLWNKNRTVSKMWSSSPRTICRNCSHFGHPSEGCKEKIPTCPICAGAYLRRDHRCPSAVCPKSGNTKPVANCCPASYVLCINCSGPHQASDAACTANPNHKSARSTSEPMDTNDISSIIPDPPLHNTSIKSALSPTSSEEPTAEL